MPTPLTDQALYDLLCVLIALLLGGFAIVGAVKLLRRTRPDLDIATPIAVAFGVRVGAALALGQVSVSQELRGGDELTFLARAEHLAALPITGRESLDFLTSQLHTFLFSLHMRILEPLPPENMLRVELIAFAVIGIALLSAAVYELAGRRAALIAAWVLALEPTNVFFSGILHKEPLMYLAEGLVAFGGAVLWKRGDLRSLFPIVIGCLLAIATRPYVGWFLVMAAAAVVLHASIVRQRGLRSLTLLAIVVLLAAAFIPVAWDETSDESLQELQASQDANAEDEEANLSLERVDYSSREKLFLNAPQRIYDVVFKPYPWQTENTSQQFGVLGTLVLFAALILLAQQLIRNRSAIMQRAGPLIYPMLFMLWAYAISAGNAGTAFRYRTHVVALALCLLVVLREARQQREAVAASKHHPKKRTAPILASVTRLAEEGADPRVAQDRPDPREFFRVLWRRKWILVLCVTLIPAAVYLYSERLTKTYEASVLMQVQSNAVDGGVPVTGDSVVLRGPQHRDDRHAHRDRRGRGRGLPPAQGAAGVAARCDSSHRRRGHGPHHDHRVSERPGTRCPYSEYVRDGGEDHPQAPGHQTRRRSDRERAEGAGRSAGEGDRPARAALGRTSRGCGRCGRRRARTPRSFSRPRPPRARYRQTPSATRCSRSSWRC